MTKKLGWNHIIVEGFCMRCSSPKKNKYVYELVSIEPYKTRKVINPLYDPKYKTPKKPIYCKDKVMSICLLNDCPHLGIAEANIPKKIMKGVVEKMEELWDNEDDEVWNDEKV